MASTASVTELPQRTSSAEKPPTGQIAIGARSALLFAFRDQKFLYGTEGKGDDAIILNPDPVLEEEGAELGLGIYDEDADGDPNLSGLYETRAQAVMGLGWEVNPAGDASQEKGEAEFVRRAFWGTPDFEGARRRAFIGSRRKGYSITEVLWGGVDGYTTILGLKDHDPRSFVFDAAWRPRIIDNPASLASARKIDPRKAQVMRHRAKAWNPYGVGIGQTIHYVATYKKHVLNFWAVFCEKHATPTLEAIYEGSAKANAASILEMAEQALERSAVAHDQAVVLKALESARAGDVQAFKQLLEFLNDEEAIAVLGQVLSSTPRPTGMNTGTATSQENVRQDYLEYDAVDCSDFLNELARMLVDANFGPRPANGYPKAVINAAPKPDTLALVETFKAAQELGMDIGREYAYSALGIPMPKDDEEVLEKPNPMVSAFGPTQGPADDPLATGRAAQGSNPASADDAAA